MVPKLRFERYCDNWFSNKLSDLAVDNTLSNGVFNDPLNVGSGYKLINVVNMYKEPCIDENDLSLLNLEEKKFRKNQVFFGDIFFTRSSLVKEGIAWTNIYLGHSEDVTFDGHLIKLTPDLKKTNPKFLYFCLKTSLVRKQLIESGKTATMTTIGQSDVGKTLVFIPQLKEQTKIADFLSSVDEKITLLNKQYDLLCQYKKGMMQKIFSRELRFKDENGETFPEWNSCQLKDVATRVTRKNKENNQTILTISGRDGLVDQMTYFNKQIASKNVSGYYLINNGEFAYNKSYSQGYPMGAIKMLTNYDQGVVSTLYICFKLNENQYKNFYQHYFESGLQNRSIEKVAQEGARNHGLLNIGVNDFFDIELQIPSLKEQIKIADFLSALDDKITTKKAELDTLKTWKQGLLQQMFV
ncbi:restriction endonuclease subunit S [Enterobacter hormaechei]|uniref:restriction endonuclease subunit S n=1 Tax=Enterobacter hormaechei TaxID=158836 RepID=UPI003CF5CA68